MLKHACDLGFSPHGFFFFSFAFCHAGKAEGSTYKNTLGSHFLVQVNKIEIFVIFSVLFCSLLCMHDLSPEYLQAFDATSNITNKVISYYNGLK